MTSCTPFWREAHLQVKKLKALTIGALLEAEMSKKCTPLWREEHFEVKMLKTPHARTTFEDCVQMWFCVACAREFCTSSKVSKTRGFCSISKHNRRCGAFEHDPERGILRGRRSRRDMFTRVVRRSGRGFPKRGCILEHQIFRFAKIIFVWQVQHFV